MSPLTPERLRQAPRRAVTLDFGDVDQRASDTGVEARYQENVLPTGSNPLKIYPYKGQKYFMGDNVLLLTKTFDKKLVCVTSYTTPEAIGLEVVRELEKKHEEGNGSLKKFRSPGRYTQTKKNKERRHTQTTQQ